MKIINFVTELSGSEDIRYIPVPARGTVKSVRVACDAAMVATKTVTFSRSTTTINLVTAPTGNTAAGTILDGVPDTTNKGLIFDPDSSTTTSQVIKMVVQSAFVGSAATLTVRIEFDDSGYVEQAASEA